MSPEEKAFELATDTLEGMVNQDERPFTEQERAELNEALMHLRKHVAQLAVMGNLSLGCATVLGFGVGFLFAKWPL